MATRICKNGHKYDDSIYGDNCPCCPASGDRTIPAFGTTTKAAPMGSAMGIHDGKTQVIGGNTAPGDGRTKIIDKTPDKEGATVIRHINVPGSTATEDGSRMMVGLLVSYNQKPNGEVYKLFEGRNVIGRDSSKCDIYIKNDNNISGVHLLILYREAEGVFWATDQDSSNGTYINGQFKGERTQLNSGDVIELGDSKFLFIAIPKF